jgi:hypothetical protein
MRRAFLQQHMADQAPGGGRQRPEQGGGGGGASWRRPPGSGISTKTKREYLRWKRQQKQQRAEEKEGGGGGSGSEGEGVWAPASQLPPGGAEEGAGAGTATAPALPLQLRARPGRSAASAASTDAPLRYAPLEEVPGAGGGARLPRCVAAEVGWTAEGRALGAPVRPAWRGVVHSAAQLHALEERHFRAWLQGLADRWAGALLGGGPGPCTAGLGAAARAQLHAGDCPAPSTRPKSPCPALPPISDPNAPHPLLPNPPTPPHTTHPPAGTPRSG